jgi:hypothetical protein
VGAVLFGGVEVDKLANGASAVMRQTRRDIGNFFGPMAVTTKRDLDRARPRRRAQGPCSPHTVGVSYGLGVDPIARTVTGLLPRAD